MDKKLLTLKKKSDWLLMLIKIYFFVKSEFRKSKYAKTFKSLVIFWYKHIKVVLNAMAYYLDWMYIKFPKKNIR